MSTTSSSSSRTMKIGIIGFGPFAQLLSKTMLKQGHSITATSRSNHSHISLQLGISFYRVCKMLEMSCEEHNRLAARSQFLTHTIGRILSEMEIESTSIDTKNFQTLVKLKESTITESFDLFSGLFIHNKFAQQELKNLEVGLEKVKHKLLDRRNEELDRNV